MYLTPTSLAFTVWRIFSSVLAHGSLPHLFMNALSLLTLGSQLEPLAGTVGLAALIVLLTAASNALYVVLCLLLSFMQAISSLHAMEGVRVRVRVSSHHTLYTPAHPCPTPTTSQ